MKPEELKIGNYVYDEGKVEKISANAFWAYIEYNCDFDELGLNPIPLTEQWLIDFGFESTEISSNIISWYNHSMAINTYSKSKVDYYWLRGYQNNVSNHIKYVHQLQNLYYALTGKELTKKI